MNLDDNRFEDSHGTRQSTDFAENKQAKTKGSSVLDKEERRKWTEMQHCPDSSFLRVQSSQIEDAFPCTPLQEGLLALSAHLPGYYVAQYKLQLRPDVDDVALQATWSHAYATTPILRTRIVDLAGEGLVQTIIDEPFEWMTADDLDGYLRHDSQRTTGTGTPLA
ncbi:hypothetical protein TSTA_034720 [Talaromyces stipitatus ATCC 10500]|uniref:Uncharacterized protein n=1 Tax=Talaromyces stipitatus (strain ATCC 10500 / CBS 375.48 / QM 6759 / NRRL 1006) TaxID=441959 RepID=B8M715_TALSN|nr:uncharacterized protein TSTA_034720 [Talaromyces stipitatus ATCC 10500]EED20235.1 hypothetical protein TSTA_034720 [Talaromyces stipitatus ATCC 10500]